MTKCGKCEWVTITANQIKAGHELTAHTLSEHPMPVEEQLTIADDMFSMFE